MLSSNDPLRTNQPPFSRESSGSILHRKLFDTFPDEMIIQVLSFSTPQTIIQFASTSRRHRSIATEEQIWFPIAFSIVKDNVDPNDSTIDEEFMRRNCNRFITTLRLGVTDATQVWYRIATKLLEQVEWTLGWWVEKVVGFSRGRVWRIFIEIDETAATNDGQDEGFFRVVATLVEVIENQTSTSQINGPLFLTFRSGGITTLQLFTEDGRASVSVEGFHPLASRLVGRGSVCGYLALGIHTPLDDDSTWYSAEQQPDHLAQPSVEANKFIGRSLNDSFLDAPYPPPQLSQLLTQRHGQGSHEQPNVPSITLQLEAGSGLSKANLVSIRRPSSFPKVPNELIRTGIYVTPYLVHGWEYLLVRVRELTEEDFQSTWPWEGSLAVAPRDVVQVTDEPDWESPHSHLGPFAGIRPSALCSSTPLRASRDHVRMGSRILEGIKIKGDSNVPGGQRSFIAFLNDPLVREEVLQEAEETLPDAPPAREDDLPWPFVSRPPTTNEASGESAYKQSYFAPERGIDIPGVMRVGQSGFSSPQWIDCVVHVECRTKFTIAAFGARGIVFRKVEDWGVCD